MQDPYYKIDRLSNSRLGLVRSLNLGLPINKVKKETLEFGRQLHEAVLEPSKYEANLLSKPEYKINQFKIAALCRAAMGNDLLRMLLADIDTLVEYDHLFEEEKYGVPSKAKIDIWLKKTIGDLKSTSAKTKADFEATIEPYGYHRQGAFYLDNTGAEKFILFGVSKIFPHPTFTVEMNWNDERIARGRAEVSELTDIYQVMKRDNKINFQELMAA